jgi:hypothetical protein
MKTADIATQTPLTRMEIAAAVSDAFGLHSVTRAKMLDCAQRSGARTEVLDALQLLPGREYGDLRQLWTDLPDMAVR